MNNIYIDDVKKILTNVVNGDKLFGKSVFITGATGLIGSAITDVLIQLNIKYNMNMKIYLGTRNIDKLNNRFLYYEDEYIPIEYDSNNKINLEEKIDLIVHCACNAFPKLFSTRPIDTIMSNVIGTNNILEYAYKNGIERVLYISSSEVYGNKENDNLYVENEYYSVDILDSRSCYPSSKRLCETLCSSYINEHDLDCVIVRPGHIYGPTITMNDNRASAEFLKNVLKEENIIMKSQGLQLRSYTHVLDCATAILTVLINGKCGEAYNISNKNSIVTIRDFAEMHAKLSGLKVIFDLPTTEEKNGYNRMKNSALNSDKLYSLGWNDVYNLENGVKETINVAKQLVLSNKR